MINKKSLFTSLLAITLSCHISYAQLAKQKDISLDEIQRKIEELFIENDKNSEEKILQEAKALAKAKNEDFNIYAAHIYSFYKKDVEAQKINKSLLIRYPKGREARKIKFNKIFNLENITVEKKEDLFINFFNEFPEEIKSKKIDSYYVLATHNLAKQYIHKNNIKKAFELLENIKFHETYVGNAFILSKDLINHNHINDAINLSEKIFNISSNADEEHRSSGYADQILVQLSELLLLNGQKEKATELLQKYVSKYPTKEIIKLLAETYLKQGRELDAFLLLDEQLEKNLYNKELLTDIKPIYEKLNSGKGNFNNYTENIDKTIKKLNITKYKSEMVKRKAPEFSLQNRKGETVSLSDLKGKVVILDFWATWCAPCIASFPGMQAAVDKYKNDNEVEFLFVNTRQREKNYKDLVEKFITDKNYTTFNVLFDEMNDPDKSVSVAYNVAGIPNKVVIDKDGYIRFQSSGGGDIIEKIVSELDAKIELAKQD